MKVIYLNQEFVLNPAQEEKFRAPNKWNVKAGNIFFAGSNRGKIYAMPGGLLTLTDQRTSYVYADCSTGQTQSEMIQTLASGNWTFNSDPLAMLIDLEFAEYLELISKITAADLVIGAEFENSFGRVTVKHKTISDTGQTSLLEPNVPFYWDHEALAYLNRTGFKKVPRQIKESDIIPGAKFSNGKRTCSIVKTDCSHSLTETTLKRVTYSPSENETRFCDGREFLEFLRKENFHAS